MTLLRVCYLILTLDRSHSRTASCVHDHLCANWTILCQIDELLMHMGYGQFLSGLQISDLET